MAVDARRRQKALTRKAAKRKAKRHTHHGEAPHGPRALPHSAAQWPLFGGQVGAADVKNGSSAGTDHRTPTGSNPTEAAVQSR